MKYPIQLTPFQSAHMIGLVGCLKRLRNEIKAKKDPHKYCELITAAIRDLERINKQVLEYRYGKIRK